MPRNLDRRVEVLFPVEPRPLRDTILVTFCRSICMIRYRRDVCSPMAVMSG
jgi:polyphosphate kinase